MVIICEIFMQNEIAIIIKTLDCLTYYIGYIVDDNDYDCVCVIKQNIISKLITVIRSGCVQFSVS